MKRYLITILLISLLMSGTAFGINPLVETEEGLIIDNSELAIEWEPFVPASIFSICNPEGKCVDIDFSGDEIVYSGELEVAESAKIFFKYYGGLCPERSSDETKKE